MLTEKQLNALKQGREAAHRKQNERVANTPFENLGWDRQRKVVISEQKNKCSHCGINEWMGKPISLEVDHIDGDRKNNTRNNLEALCPNCHSQTATWRGRNMSCGKKKVADELLRAAIEANDGNIRQALLSVGLAAKGGNYARAKKLAP